MRTRTVAFTLASLLLPAAASAAEAPDVLDQILRGRPELATVLQQAERHRLQILYTQIDRDAANKPTFRSYGYRLDDPRYFYPASTVKLPAAVLALEKLHDLKVPGLTRDTPLRIEAGTPRQTAVDRDESKADGLPTIAHFVKKIFLVSDNDAFNRLFEFLGQRGLNERLWELGHQDARILRRLEAGMDDAENRVTNPFVFFQGPKEIHRQPLARNDAEWTIDRPDVRQGRGYIKDGALVEQPMDFSRSNFLSLKTLQDVLKAVVFPEAMPQEKRLRLSEDDRRFLLRAMSTLPRESTEPAYPNRDEFPDAYVKYFLYAGSKQPIPANIRIYNKVGQAYGYLLDDAYVVDFDNGVEFLLTAVLQVNDDQVYNDDKYEYDTVGFPFLAQLGRAVYEHELKRPRPRRPDLSHLR